MSTMELLANFATNVRAEMERVGMTSAELAKRSGLHYVTVSRILNGHICPTLETCERLAKALGMRADTAFLEPLEKTSK